MDFSQEIMSSSESTIPQLWKAHDKAHPPARKTKATQLEYKTTIAEIFSTKETVQMPPNPTFFFQPDDIFKPEAPKSVHLSLTKMRIRSRGKKGQDEVGTIAVGYPIFLKGRSGSNSCFLVFEIMVSFRFHVANIIIVANYFFPRHWRFFAHIRLFWHPESSEFTAENLKVAKKPQKFQKEQEV